MKNLLLLTTIILFVVFSFVGIAQDFSRSSNQAIETYGQVPMPEPDAFGTTITHSVDPVTIVVGSAACADANGVTGDNQYWRSFVLSGFGITEDFTVTMVDIGIELATAGSGGVQPMTCNLYITDGTPFPGGFPGSLSLIGTLFMNVPDQALTHFPIPVTGTAPAGSELVVEISIPDATGGEDHMFLIGSNNLGQTAPSYVSSVGCEIFVPTDIAELGYPDMHIVMSVTGDEVVPVELTSFTASANFGVVDLQWITATETNNSGFEVQRSDGSDFETIAFVEGFGTTTERQEYSFSDRNVTMGKYFYRLKQIDFDGTFEYSNEIEVDAAPVTFSLGQNYPNPFNPITNISYILPTESQVKLSIYNSLGEIVETIINEKQDAGKYDAVWNAGNHPSGVYIYTLDAVSLNGSKQTKISKKMILMK